MKTQSHWLFRFCPKALLFSLILSIAVLTSCHLEHDVSNVAIPPAWTTYQVVKTIDEDFTDLKSHGVDVVIIGSFEEAPGLEMARNYLAAARRHDMKLVIRTGNHLLPNADIVLEAGLEPEYGVMIGGVFEGKAVDRHLFNFTAAPQQIIIEPPVYNQKFAYTGRVSNEPIAHYYPGIGDPVKAEIIVPLKEYDGVQHLEIIEASITKLSTPMKLDPGSVSSDMPESYEIKDRNLYQLSFDLSAFGDGLLDKVGIAVYWEFRGSEEWYILNWAPVSVTAPTTVQAVCEKVSKTLSYWTEVNGGVFPDDQVIALRFGDEPFFITGHVSETSPSVNYPLWDYSSSALKAYKDIAGTIKYPRTWGFPEIYGDKAYSYWLYAQHKNCAEITRIAKEEAAKTSEKLLVFRNTTRMGVFSQANDHDGSGPELLTRELDLVHIDPYPVSSTGYGQEIPRDMAYYGGLSRRYEKPLVPWMQAHQYGALTHVTPEHINRMTQEQWEQGVDGIIWLGYSKDDTFPLTNPESWEAAGAFHHKLKHQLSPKPDAKLAVIRSYDAWALSSITEDKIRNPADWLMQQWLEIWSVKYEQPYDVFELSPTMDQAALDSIHTLVAHYKYSIANLPFEDAWFVGEDVPDIEIPISLAPEYQATFEKEIKDRGWL